MRGYFAIGVYHPKSEINIGTLWRSAYAFGAGYIFTIGRRYKKQASDTTKSWRHIPLFHYITFDEFYNNIPYDCKLVGIENVPLAQFTKEYNHPQRALYLLGAEDHGLPEEILNKCHDIIQIKSNLCLNVSVAGSIIIYDRLNKLK